MKQIPGLYYSSKEKILFYIPNYYTNGTGLLNGLIENLKAGEAILRQFEPTMSIYCREITKSSRYKYMWYFKVFLDTCPEEAFELGKDWTFNSWIEN